MPLTRPGAHAVRQAGGRAELRLADERALVRGDVATLRGTLRALAPGNPGRDNRLPARLAPGPRGTYTIAIGLTGDPVPVGSRSGAIMHRNDHRRISAHTCLSSLNTK